MGQRTRQRILTCSWCGTIPEDGEPMWEMGSEVWCESCCDESDSEPVEVTLEY